MHMHALYIDVMMVQTWCMKALHIAVLCILCHGLIYWFLLESDS